MSMKDYTAIVSSQDWLCAGCGKKRSEHACLKGFHRTKYRFVAMLRIKNEAEHIGEVLESILPLCSRVYILDDHSTDNTVEVCHRYSNVVVFPSPFEGLNERRDKNWLYDRIIEQCEPDWILCIDGDEVLERRGPEIIENYCIEADEGFNSLQGTRAFKLKIEFFWADRHAIRTDRIYGDFWRPSLFKPYLDRPEDPDSLKLLDEFRFKSTPFGRHVDGNEPHLHCSSIPQRLLHGAQICPARLKHYGYNTRSRRVAKLDFYTSIDWGNWAEDCYRHMTQGDDVRLDELPKVKSLMDRGELGDGDVLYLIDTPPNATLLHAGPLIVEPWDEDKPWRVSDWAQAQCAGHGIKP